MTATVSPVTNPDHLKLARAWAKRKLDLKAFAGRDLVFDHTTDDLTSTIALARRMSNPVDYDAISEVVSIYTARFSYQIENAEDDDERLIATAQLREIQCLAYAEDNDLKASDLEYSLIVYPTVDTRYHDGRVDYRDVAIVVASGFKSKHHNSMFILSTPNLAVLDVAA